MGNNDHCHTVFCQLLHYFQNFAYHFRIQRRCGFIKQHDIGTHCQRTGNGNTLLLTAGKIWRIFSSLFRQTNCCQQSFSSFFCLRLCQFLSVNGRQHDIFQNTQVREQIELLEHHTDVFPYLVDIAFGICNIVIINNYSACSCFFQFVQAAQKCGLTGTGRTDQTNNFPFFYFQVDSLQYFQAAEAFFQLFNFYLDHLFASLLSTNWKIFVRTTTTT